MIETIAQYYLEHPERWVRFTELDPQGNSCLRGACVLIYGSALPLYEGEFPLVDALEEIMEVQSVLDYNDKIAEDVWEIIDVCTALGI